LNVKPINNQKQHQNALWHGARAIMHTIFIVFLDG